MSNLAKIDIVALIEKDSKTRLSRDYENALINKIKGSFTAEEQQLFVASFYCYLNYDSKKDFVIDFKDVWKWCGFTRKDNAKTVLERHFVLDLDYKVENLVPPIAGASLNSQNTQNDVEEVIAPAIAGASLNSQNTQKYPSTGCAGYNKEKITLTINTFKKFCMKAGTKKADQIHDYYIKLEELLQETLKEQTDELQKQLEEKNKKIYDQNHLLKQADLKIKSIEKSKQNLLNRRYTSYKKGPVIYLFRDNMLESNPQYKIGLTDNISEREKDYSNYNKSGKIVHIRYCINCKLAEELLHHILDKYRVLANREWFKFPSQEFAITTIDNIIHIMDCGGDLQNVEKFITDLNARLNYNFVASDTFEKKEDTFEEINRDYNAPTIVEKTLEKKEEPYVPASIIDSIPLEKTKNQKTHLSSQIELERNPKDFGKFVQDFCEVGEDFMDSKTKLKDAYCIWSKTDDLTNKKDLEKYLKTNFRSGVGIFPGESCRKNVFRGIKTKPLKFTPSSKNLDYEKFVLAECKVDYDCRISFTDFYNYFIEWKRISDPTYTISLKIKQDLKTFLVSNFLPGRIIDKQDEKDTKKFSHGVFGIGHEKNNFGFREAFRNKNSIEVCDSKTGDVLKKFDSCILAAQFYGIPYWTIGRYIRNEEVFQEKIFKYC